MAYSDRDTSGSRVVAIVIVAIILAGVGYAFVTGLAVQFAKNVVEKTTVFDVEEPPPPPPEDPPPPPPDQPMTPPPVVTPPPIVQTNTPPPVVIQSVTTPPPAIVMTPQAAPPAPPVVAVAPPAPRISQAAKSKGQPATWYSTDDYPPAALRDEAEGRVQARLTVGTDGRVSACSVISSSGNTALDQATCRVAQRRGRYTPAKDQSGNPIQSADTISIRWQMPQD